MLRKLWLVFAQALAVLFALYFITDVLRPQWAHILFNKPVYREASSIPTTNFRTAVETGMPAVVNIFTSKKISLPKNHPFMEDPELRKFFGEDPNGEPLDEDASSLGSGVLVSEDGLIITNHHVVEAADQIEVGLNDGRTAQATLVGSDPETDLAVLRIKLDNLPSLKFAADDSARIGDVVLAIGNPFGVGQTVTMGIISAMGRNHVGINTFENFIQTDAAINPGNSGGALIDTAGHLLGINTAIYSRSGGSLGIGFAIPAKTVQTVLNQLVKTGSVTRGYIGVEQQSITAELATAFNLPMKEGVIIAGVVKDGPADKAGLKVGDILLSIDERKIKDTTEMLNVIAGLTPGDKKAIEVLRDGKPKSIQIEIGVRPQPGDLLKK